MDINPYFKSHPYDVMAPWVPASMYHNQRYPSLTHSIVPRVDSKESTITLEKDKFQICLDVHQFAPQEISVKTADRHVVVEGKHEEKEDEHGSVSRHFVRKYLLPEGHKSEDVVSSLSSDGVLTITAPKNKPSLVKGERVVHISVTGPVRGIIKLSSPDPK